jgi:hypothetical protein
MNLEPFQQKGDVFGEGRVAPLDNGPEIGYAGDVPHGVSFAGCVLTNRESAG